ncbi:hypothetical protein [Flavobacterium cerinum]|uniref:Uncharacterized protein n=1 Tax=Flavobacterium cerinum TaxID=2502784 RepID=A0ABY5IPP7_9FLAO|nr:hypothetical protein [Flavobacterium cerinum]UUC44806.1 hypothetical protein NOX80_14365 [Flavobacterium cerinum]
MKYILFILLSLNSCHKEVIKEEICLVGITYNDNEQVLGPSAIKLDFIDKANFLEKKIKANSLKTVFFYAYEINQRKSTYMKRDYYEKKKDTISLYATTSYFESDKFKKWTSNEIKSFLKKEGIGIVIDNDTLKILECKH